MQFGKRKIIVGIVSILFATSAGVYTLASFSAQTRNPNNSFGTGTLVLSNTKQGNATCYSTGGGNTNSNVNNGCSPLIAMTLAKPGDSATSRLTLKNEGSLAASALQMYAGACASSDTAGETYHGTGDMCSKVQVYVQAYSDSSFTTKSSCLFGGGTATVCDFSDVSKTVGLLSSTYSSGSPLGLGALASGSSDYFEIGFAFASNADNTYQGRSAAFDLTWQLSQ